MPQQPKDLGVKIGSPDEVFWTAVKKKAEEDILNSERTIEINTSIIDYADKRIEEEKENFK